MLDTFNNHSATEQRCTSRTFGKSKLVCDGANQFSVAKTCSSPAQHVRAVTSSTMNFVPIVFVCVLLTTITCLEVHEKNVTADPVIKISKLSDRRYCGYQHKDDYISENDDISIDEFPWVAAIWTMDTRTREERTPCDGSLINNRYVLTAAQCLEPHVKNIVILHIRLGEFHVDNKTDCVEIPGSDTDDCSIYEDYGVEKQIPHPLYNRTAYKNDIGLIRLNRTVTYSDYIRPICLPVPGIKLAEPGDTLYSSGWGVTHFASNFTKIKKKIATALLSNEECIKQIPDSKLKGAITEDHLCTVDYKNNTEFSCQGDGGAPKMFSYRHQWHIEGITSAGFRCGMHYPEINTRVTHYLDWIAENMHL